MRKIVGFKWASKTSSLIKQAINTGYSPSSKNREPYFSYPNVFLRRYSYSGANKYKNAHHEKKQFPLPASLQFRNLPTQTTLLG